MDSHRIDPRTWLTSRAFLLRVFFFVLAALFLFADLDRTIQAIGLGAIYDSAFALLNDSLKQATGTLVLLTVMKGFMEAFSSIEISIFVANANLGGLLAGIKDVIDTLFRFFLSMTGLLTAQIGFLSLLQISGLKMFVGGGAAMLAISPTRATGLGKIGILGITIGLTLCLLFPLLVASVGNALNHHQVSASIESTENLGVMREQFSDISMRDLAREEGLNQARDTFQTGTRQIWDGMLNLFVTYTMMFLFLPVISLGICYAIIRYVLSDVIGHEGQAGAADSKITGALAWIKGPEKQEAETPDTDQDYSLEHEETTTKDAKE